MVLRQALLAAVLVSGSAAAAAAQSDEFPFRRFGKHWVGARHDFRMRDFAFRDFGRLRFNSHHLPFLRDNLMRLRKRGFAMREGDQRHRMELRFRDMDRIRDRIRERMDNFRFERPLIMRRHSRTI